MRKMLSAALLMCTVALLSTLLMPTALATKPTYVSGYMKYIPKIIDWRWDDEGNLHLDTTEEGWWYDDYDNLIGHSYDEPCRVVIHGAIGFPPTNWDFRWYTAIATFEYFMVDGKSGGLVMRLHGKSGEPGSEWSGEWVILEGTEELEGIHGQGTWSGLGYPAGDIPYEGWIHFD